MASNWLQHSIIILYTMTITISILYQVCHITHLGHYRYPFKSFNWLDAAIVMLKFYTGFQVVLQKTACSTVGRSQVQIPAGQQS